MKKLVSVALLGLVACGKTSSDPAPGASPSAAMPASSAAAAAPSASAAAPPEDTSAYSVVLEAPDGAWIVPMTGGAIATASRVLFLLGEGPLVQDPGFVRGIKKSEQPFVDGGMWPKAAWIETSDAEGKTKLYKYFDSLGGRWEPQAILREGETLLDIGVIGANAVAAIAMPSKDIRFTLVGGKGGLIPAPSAAAKPEGREAEPGEADDFPAEDTSGCKVKMAPEAPYLLAGTPTGEAFAVGHECKDDGSTGAPVVERWEAKKVRGTVEPLPAPASGTLLIRGVLATSGTDAWVYGGAGDAAYLAHWDGKAWALEKGAFEKEITKMSAADDGTLYVAAKDGVFSRKAGGAFEAVVLPKSLSGFEATSVYARTASDVWIAGKSGGKGYLLRSAKVDKPAVMPSEKAVEDTLRSNVRWLATPLCNKVYAHLFSVGPSATPVPKEFPAAKKAFEGKKFEGAKLVLEDDGRNLFVGAKVTSMEQAESIVKAFSEANPKMTPRIFCHDPQVKKDLEWP